MILCNRRIQKACIFYESVDADVFTGVIHVFFKPDILVSAFNQSA